MIPFRYVLRLASLYGWFPMADPQEIELYWCAQFNAADEALGTSRTATTDLPKVLVPHRLAPDLLTLATALERSLPDIPPDIGDKVPASLMEAFAGEGKDWLQKFIVLCRGQL